MQLKDKLLEAFSEFLEKAVGTTAQEQKSEVVDEEMVSYEVIYEPFIKDAHGEWMSDKTIEKAMENFNKNFITFIESTWVQKELDVKVIQTDEIIKAGTWVAKIKYNDADLWQLKKSGVVGGLSIFGKGAVNKTTGEITNVKFDGED